MPGHRERELLPHYVLPAIFLVASCLTGCQVRAGVTTASISVVLCPHATWSRYSSRTSARSRRRSQSRISSWKGVRSSGEGGVYAAHAATNWEEAGSSSESPPQAIKFAGSGQR